MRERTIWEKQRIVPTVRPDREPEREVRTRGKRVRSRPRRPTFQNRSERALADVGIHACVPFRDVAEVHFGGHLQLARRAVNDWIREGLATGSTTEDEGGMSFEVITLTRKGTEVLRDLAPGQGLDPAQEFTPARKLRHGQLLHDASIYRACQRERERLDGEGARVRRVRLASELTAVVRSRSGLARLRGGQRAADAARHRAAEELGLPIDGEGRVVYPDARIEYVDADGRSDRVDIEVVTDRYGRADIQAKISAGFRMHASGPRADRMLGRLLPGGTGL